MELFGENFIDVRNRYIIPSISFGVGRHEYESWNFKDTVSNNSKNFSSSSKNAFQVEINKSDFFKALHCDIELSLNKTTIQYIDLLYSKGQSKSWSYVTLYYFLFFGTNTLFRLLHSGNVFFYQNQIARFEALSTLSGYGLKPLSTGNYRFSVQGENSNGDILLNFTFQGDNLHKKTWYQFEAIIRGFLPNCDSEEKAIFMQVIEIFKKYTIEFPSQTRNMLNYTGESSMLEIRNKIVHMNLKEFNKAFIKKLFTVDLIGSSTLKNQMECTAFLSLLVFKYVQKLYGEYSLRSGYGQDFAEERKKLIQRSGFPLIT